MTFKAFIVGLVAMAAMPAMAQEFPKNIMTGGASGTYIKIGQDIAGLGAQCGQTLTVNESAGSLANILAVRDRRNTQFGIVQSDVLDYFRAYSTNDAALARAVDGVVIAAPLYNEEVQILAKKDIASVADLAGRKVSVGNEGSGTFLTSSLVLGMLETQIEEINLPAQDSLAALLDGSIDAMFYVAGAPTALLQDPAIDGERFHLLPLSEAILKEAYVPVTLDANTYAFQSDPVDLVAVKAVLMTYDFDRNRNGYHRLSCDAVADFTNLLVTNFSALKESGHPKWNDVDLTEIPPGWEIGECVNRGLDPDYQPQCTAPVVEAAAESDANSVYRQRICSALGDC